MVQLLQQVSPRSNFAGNTRMDPGHRTRNLYSRRLNFTNFSSQAWTQSPI